MRYGREFNEKVQTEKVIGCEQFNLIYIEFHVELSQNMSLLNLVLLV